MIKLNYGHITHVERLHLYFDIFLNVILTLLFWESVRNTENIQYIPKASRCIIQIHHRQLSVISNSETGFYSSCFFFICRVGCCLPSPILWLTCPNLQRIHPKWSCKTQGKTCSMLASCKTLFTLSTSICTIPTHWATFIRYVDQIKSINQGCIIVRGENMQKVLVDESYSAWCTEQGAISSLWSGSLVNSHMWHFQKNHQATHSRLALFD